MRKLLTILLLLATYISYAQTEKIGETGLTTKSPFDSTSTYEPGKGIGAWYSEVDTAALHRIPPQRFRNYMWRYVGSNDSLYILINGVWTPQFRLEDIRTAIVASGEVIEDGYNINKTGNIISFDSTENTVVKSLRIRSANGGYLYFMSSATAPVVTLGNNDLIIYDRSGHFAWKKQVDGFERRFVSTLTGNRDYTWQDTSGKVMLDISSSNLKLITAGNGIYIKEGTNATMGVATLVGGTVTINTTKITATSRVLLSIQSLGTVTLPTTIGVTARTSGTSFVITSASATDTSVIMWWIIEPS